MVHLHSSMDWSTSRLIMKLAELSSNPRSLDIIFMLSVPFIGVLLYSFDELALAVLVAQFAFIVMRFQESQYGYARATGPSDFHASAPVTPCASSAPMAAQTGGFTSGVLPEDDWCMEPIVDVNATCGSPTTSVHEHAMAGSLQCTTADTEPALQHSNGFTGNGRDDVGGCIHQDNGIRRRASGCQLQEPSPSAAAGLCSGTIASSLLGCRGPSYYGAEDCSGSCWDPSMPSSPAGIASTVARPEHASAGASTEAAAHATTAGSTLHVELPQAASSHDSQDEAAVQSPISDASSQQDQDQHQQRQQLRQQQASSVKPGRSSMPKREQRHSSGSRDDAREEQANCLDLRDGMSLMPLTSSSSSTGGSSQAAAQEPAAHTSSSMQVPAAAAEADKPATCTVSVQTDPMPVSAAPSLLPRAALGSRRSSRTGEEAGQDAASTSLPAPPAVAAAWMRRRSSSNCVSDLQASSRGLEPVATQSAHGQPTGSDSSAEQRQPGGAEDAGYAESRETDENMLAHEVSVWQSRASAAESRARVAEDAAEGLCEHVLLLEGELERVRELLLEAEEDGRIAALEAALEVASAEVSALREENSALTAELSAARVQLGAGVDELMSQVRHSRADLSQLQAANSSLLAQLSEARDRAREAEASRADAVARLHQRTAALHTAQAQQRRLVQLCKGQGAVCLKLTSELSALLGVEGRRVRQLAMMMVERGAGSSASQPQQLVPVEGGDSLRSVGKGSSMGSSVVVEVDQRGGGGDDGGGLQQRPAGPEFTAPSPTAAVELLPALGEAHGDPAATDLASCASPVAAAAAEADDVAAPPASEAACCSAAAAEAATSLEQLSSEEQDTAGASCAPPMECDTLPTSGQQQEEEEEEQQQQCSQPEGQGAAESALLSPPSCDDNAASALVAPGGVHADDDCAVAAAAAASVQLETPPSAAASATMATVQEEEGAEAEAHLSSATGERTSGTPVAWTEEEEGACAGSLAPASATAASTTPGVSPDAVHGSEPSSADSPQLQQINDSGCSIPGQHAGGCSSGDGGGSSSSDDDDDDDVDDWLLTGEYSVNAGAGSSEDDDDDDDGSISEWVRST